MKRRSFFGVAAAASGAVMLPSSPAKADGGKVVRTAVTVPIVCTEFAPTEAPVEMPDGFVPVAAAAGSRSTDFMLRLFDDEGDVLDLHCDAFRFGPLDLWRPVVGRLRCSVEPLECPSVLPVPIVIIYGEIDIE